MRVWRVAAVGALVVAAAGCDWEMVRGDAGRTGNAAEDVLGAGNVAGLAQAWVAHTGAQAPAGPVTAAGAVMVVDGDSVVAYEADSGELRWDSPLPPFIDPNPPRQWTGPSARAGTVHVGYANPLTSGGSSGGFVEFDGVTGESTGGDACCGGGGGAAPSSSPSFDGGDTWFAATYVEPMATGAWAGPEGRLGDGRTLRALTASSGTIGTSGAPAIADGMAYFGRPGGGALDAIDATGAEGCTPYGSFSNCTPLWSATVTGMPQVAASGDAVYATTGEGVAAFATGDGVRGPDQQPRWRAVVAGATPVALTPAADATSVLVGSSDGTLRAFAAGGCGAATCAPTWVAPTGGATTAPVVANGVAYVGSADGRVHAFAAAGCGAATCAPLWTASAPGAPATVVVANARVFVTTTAGDLVAYALP